MSEDEERRNRTISETGIDLAELTLLYHATGLLPSGRVATMSANMPQVK
jgi:hypothetical protein